MADHHVAEGVQVGVLEGVLVRPGLVGGGFVGGEEERGAIYPHMTPLRLVHGGVRLCGAGQHDIIHIVGVQPDVQDRHLRVVLQDPVQPIGEGARLLPGNEKGAAEADAGNGGGRGDHHLAVGVGGEVGAAQAIGASIASSALSSLGSPGLVDKGGQQRHLG